MAKKKVSKAAPAEAGEVVKGAKESVWSTRRIILSAAFFMALVFMSSTILLFIGMLPTLASFFVDRSHRKSKTLSVGALNLAGCFPFLLELWVQDHSIAGALNLVLNPMNIVVMYFSAAVGYMVDWVTSGLVANILYGRGQARKKEILEQQEALVARWGDDVKR